MHLIYSPLDLGHTTSMINVEVDDVDAHYARAVAEGAEVTMPLADAWYGARRYEATDLEGHRWHFDESHAHIRARGGEVPDARARGLPDPAGGVAAAEPPCRVSGARGAGPRARSPITLRWIWLEPP